MTQVDDAGTTSPTPAPTAGGAGPQPSSTALPAGALPRRRPNPARPDGAGGGQLGGPPADAAAPPVPADLPWLERVSGALRQL